MKHVSPAIPAPDAARATLRAALSARDLALSDVAACQEKLGRARAVQEEAEAGVVTAERADETAALALAVRLKAVGELTDAGVATLVDVGAELSLARSRLRVVAIALEDRTRELAQAERELEASKAAVAAAITNVLTAEAETLAELIDAQNNALLAVRCRLGGRYDFVARTLPVISERLRRTFFENDDSALGRTGHPSRQIVRACAEAWDAFSAELATDPAAELRF